MCTGGVIDEALSAGEGLSVAAGLRVMDSVLDLLNGPAIGDLEAASLGDVVESLAGLSGKLAAARAAVLVRFDAGRGYTADGYGSSAAWLAARTRATRKAAGTEVRRMRQLAAHPLIAGAVARGEVSESWADDLARRTSKLPADWRDDVDKLLVDTAAAGAAFPAPGPR